MEAYVPLCLTGIGTPIRRGLGGISLLKWSPSGDYFFASKLYCSYMSLNYLFILIQLGT